VTSDEPGEPTFVCPNCGRTRVGETPDPAGWCAACRGEVVRRATRMARVAAVLAAALAALVLGWTGAFSSLFMVGWLALAALVVYGVFKVARRVAFDVVRSRGVTPPPED
jgi:hypothetical protein